MLRRIGQLPARLPEPAWQAIKEAHNLRKAITGMNRNRWIELAFIAGSTVLALLFVLAPGIDLWFSAVFYGEPGGFYLQNAWWVRFLYKLVAPVTVVIGIGLLALLAHNLIRRHAVGPFTTRAVLFLIAALAIGPGLVVNTVFKDQWGRARPRDIIEFGGVKEFTPAFALSDQCDRNCSFVSGHSSVPFALIAFGFVLRRRRRAILAGATLFGGLVGLGRIIQGAHFLSDVIFSGIFVFVIAYLLAHAFRLPGLSGDTKG